MIGLAGLRSHSILVFASLGSLLMPGAFGQTPQLTLGAFTSNEDLDCIVSGNILNLEGIVVLNGADASDWNRNGVEFRSPQMLICTASLLDCPPSTPSDCYCEQFNSGAGIYTVKFTKPADASLSQQSISLAINRSNPVQSVTGEQTAYPYVNRDVSTRISYGTKSKYSDITGTNVDIPNDSQFLNLTFDGLRQPFTISYTTDVNGNRVEVDNEDHVTIPLVNNETLLTVRYDEGEYCEREGDYSFTVTQVMRQRPYLYLGALTSACPVEGRGSISLQATVVLPDADASDWSQRVHLSYEDSQGVNQELCSALLNPCPPSDVSAVQCYCQQKNGDIYFIVGNLGQQPSLSGQEIRLEMFSANSLVLQTSNYVVYPTINRDDIRIMMTYFNDGGNSRRAPPVNNSLLDHPEDNQRLTFEVFGLVQPFSIVYVSRGDFEVTDNLDTVTFAIDDDVESFQVYYEEDLNCHRKAEYHFTLEDDDNDDLSTGEIIAIIFGGILFFVIIFFFIIVYLLVRARGNDKKKYRSSPRNDVVEERGGIIDYSTKDIEDGLVAENGPSGSHDNKAYVVDVPANSSSVVMNPVYDEAVQEPEKVVPAEPQRAKENEYTSLDPATQNEPGPSYASFNTGKPVETETRPVEVDTQDVKPHETNHNYAELEAEKPIDTTPDNENLNDVNTSNQGQGQGPYVSIISTSL